MSTSLLRQGAYTIGFDVNVALCGVDRSASGTRETMGNPTVNNYTAGDGRVLDRRARRRSPLTNPSTAG